MKGNNIIAAPEVAEASTLYKQWKQSHIGGYDEYYNFLTTPSEERDRLLEECACETTINNGVTAFTFKYKKQ